MSSELKGWIDKLRDSNKLIIVEGKKDKAALKSLDISNIRHLKEPLYKAVEEIAAQHKDVIILTDLDRQGKLIYAKLNHDLQRHGVRVDHYFREFLFRYTKLRQIEGLPHYLEHAP